MTMLITLRGYLSEVTYFGVEYSATRYAKTCFVFQWKRDDRSELVRMSEEYLLQDRNWVMRIQSLWRNWSRILSPLVWCQWETEWRERGNYLHSKVWYLQICTCVGGHEVWGQGDECCYYKHNRSKERSDAIQSLQWRVHSESVFLHSWVIIDLFNTFIYLFIYV